MLLEELTIGKVVRDFRHKLHMRASTSLIANSTDDTVEVAWEAGAIVIVLPSGMDVNFATKTKADHRGLPS